MAQILTQEEIDRLFEVVVEDNSEVVIEKIKNILENKEILPETIFVNSFVETVDSFCMFKPLFKAEPIDCRKIKGLWFKIGSYDVIMSNELVYMFSSVLLGGDKNEFKNEINEDVLDAFKNFLIECARLLTDNRPKLSISFMGIVDKIFPDINFVTYKYEDTDYVMAVKLNADDIDEKCVLKYENVLSAQMELIKELYKMIRFNK